MAVKSLGLVGIRDMGVYSPDETYLKGHFVYYMGSTYLCLLNNIKGVEPKDDGQNWKYLARGSGDMAYKIVELSPEDLEESSVHPGFNFSYNVPWDGAKETDFTIATIETDNYASRLGAESKANRVTLYFAKRPESTVGMYVFLQGGSVAEGEDDGFYTASEIDEIVGVGHSESGSIAEAEHSKDSYFVKDGKLTKALSDVSAGDEFSDENVKNTSITEEFISKKDVEILIKSYLSNYTPSYLPITDLGTSYTQELKEDIVSGTFKKAIVGGKLTLNEHEYIFAHPDYWFNTGDTACTTHHMVVVPARELVSGKMNSTNTTTGAYAGSDFRTGNNGNTALADVKAIIQNDFGAANILTHRELFANAATNGKQTAGSWYDSDIDLMNERMVYGNSVFEPGCDGSTVPYIYTIDKSQLKLFAERPDLITTRSHWWLRDVVSGAYFAYVAHYGNASSVSASASLDVRPAFAIC